MHRLWNQTIRLVGLLAAMCVLAAPAFAGETTGGIRGTVLDDGGLPIPLVLLTLTSPALIGGSQQRNSDDEGRFAFEALPPGTYEVVAQKQGFGQVNRREIAVAAGRVTTLAIELKLGSEEVEVSSRSQVFTKEYLSRIPSGRSYQDVVGSTAGVIGGGNPSSGGAAANENTYWLPNTEGYRDPGVNRMTATEADALSTFGTDVDTGSFTLARRMLLEEGRLPDPAGVRVEEFVNYPDWDYPPPEEGAPVSVTLEAAPHPWQPGHHLLRVGLRAQDPPGERPPANLVFLVDVSGSMQGADRLPRARAALHTLVDALGPADTVALVTYAGATRVVLEPTSAAKKAHLHAAIDDLSASGSTAMGAGIDLAYGLARATLRPGQENRVIVLSDGDANVGNTTPEALLTQIERYAGQGITLSTIGFGVGNYQDVMMERFADKGDGNYYYIDSLDEAERVFTRDLTGTIQTVARDVKVQVEFDPAVVRAWRLVGYENRDVADADFRVDAVDGGEMGSGQRVTVLYDLVLEGPAGRARPQDTLATVRFRAKVPGVDAPAHEWLTSLRARDVAARFEAASADFRAAAALSGLAELLRHSPHVGNLTLAEVATLLADAPRPGRDDGDAARMVSAAIALGGRRAVTTAR